MTKLGCLVKKSAHGYASVILLSYSILIAAFSPKDREGMYFRCWMISFFVGCVMTIIYEAVVNRFSSELYVGVLLIFGFFPPLLTPLYSAFYDCYIEGDAE